MTEVLVFATSRQEFLPIFIWDFLLDLLAASLRRLLRHDLLILPLVGPAEPQRRGSERMCVYARIKTAVVGRT